MKHGKLDSWKIPRKWAEIKSEAVKAKYFPKGRKDIKPQTQE